MLQGNVKEDIVRPTLRAIVNRPWYDSTGHFVSHMWHSAVCMALGERKYRNIMNFVSANKEECCCIVFVGDTSEGDVHAAQRLLREGCITAAFVLDAATNARLLSCFNIPDRQVKNLHLFRGYDQAAERSMHMGYISIESCD